MIYSYVINVPSSTPESSPVITVLKMQAGVISQFDLDIPDGHSGLAFLSVKRAVHSVWPSNTGSYFSGDGVSISHKEGYELFKPPFQLEVVTYNLDDTYDHTFYLRLGLIPLKKRVRKEVI